LVALGVEVEGIGTCAVEAERLVTERAQKRIVAPGFTGHDRKFQPRRSILLHEAQRIWPREALATTIHAFDLRKIGRVVGRYDRRPQLLQDPAAVLLEGLLEASHLRVAECAILREPEHSSE